MQFNDRFYESLDKIKSGPLTGITKRNTPLQKKIAELKEMKGKTFNIQKVLDEIGDFRERSGRAFSNGRGTIGGAYKDAAKALEFAIDDHLKKTGESPELVKNYISSRTSMSQASALLKKGVMDAEGNVNASKLADALGGWRNKGDLDAVVTMGEHFPNSVQTKKSRGEAASKDKHLVGLGLGTVATGVGGAVAHTVAGAVGGGVIGGAGALAYKGLQVGVRSDKANKTIGKAMTAKQAISKEVKGRNKKLKNIRDSTRAMTAAGVLGSEADEQK